MVVYVCVVHVCMLTCVALCACVRVCVHACVLCRVAVNCYVCYVQTAVMVQMNTAPQCTVSIDVCKTFRAFYLLCDHICKIF